MEIVRKVHWLIGHEKLSTIFGIQPFSGSLFNLNLLFNSIYVIRIDRRIRKMNIIMNYWKCQMEKYYLN